MARFVPKHGGPTDNEGNYINILLLGETGAGKSTFINSFVNYLHYSSLSDAAESTLTCLIPTKFSIVTEDGENKVITFNKDDNEDDNLGNSSTQGTKAYVFPFENSMIRVIDTPGINDSRGAVTKDRENFENILDYIGQFQHLHAICFLLKPDVTVLTASFKYCLVELFSRLDRSAATNISFLFSRTRSTDYKAPDTIHLLSRVLADIEASEQVTIPLRYRPAERKNCFYFDNEGFKQLVAFQQGHRSGDAATCQKSWDVSYQSSWDLLSYIIGDGANAPLPPHVVQDTITVNEARRLIFELAKPLADITEFVQDNLDVLARHQEDLLSENSTAEELRAKLYVPVVDLVETQLAQPVTVCASAQCATKYTVSGLTKYHYEQRCHNPCYLHNIQKDLVGDPGLIHCAAMGGTQKCKVCKCEFGVHMHVYYETKTVESKIQDTTIQAQLTTNAEIIKTQFEFIHKLEKHVQEYQDEHKVISNALATFAYFLKNNSICPINDCYEAYLDCLIQREKIALGSNKDLLRRYESLKMEHIEQKKVLENAGRLAQEQKITHVTSEQIIMTVNKLKTLPLTGQKIANLHSILVGNKRNEMQRNTEYVHGTKAKKPQPLATGAKPKTKKGKAVQDDEQKQLMAMLNSGNFEDALAFLQTCIEEQNKQKEKDADLKQQMEMIMKMFQENTNDQTEQKKATAKAAKANPPPKNQWAGANRGRGSHNAGGRPQQWSNQPHRGNFNQGRGGGNQYRGNFHQNNNNAKARMFYNSGSHQAAQPHPQQPPHYQQPRNFMQGHPYPQQYQQPPHFQQPQQYQQPAQYQQPQQRPYDPVQVNINLSNQAADYQQRQAASSSFDKYVEPPPAYSPVVHPPVYTPNNQRNVRRGGPAGAVHNQFKKPVARKQPQFNKATAVADADEGDEDEEEEEQEEADGPSTEDMKNYLAETRRKLQEQREAEAERKKQLRQKADEEAANADKVKLEKIMESFMNMFKKK